MKHPSVAAVPLILVWACGSVQRALDRSCASSIQFLRRFNAAIRDPECNRRRTRLQVPIVERLQERHGLRRCKRVATPFAAARGPDLRRPGARSRLPTEVREHRVGHLRCRRPPPAPRAWRGGRRRGCRTSVSSVLRRRGPMPGTASSSDRRSRMLRALRWKVTANRCASSRIRCSSSSAGSFAASAIGSACRA